MRRAIVTALTAALLTAGAGGPPGNAAEARLADSPASGRSQANEWRSRECRFARLDGHGGWVQREVIATIGCAVARWPVAGGVGFAIEVAACESGLRANASNGGRYLGVYQHAASAWPWRVNHYTPKAWGKSLHPSAFNARSNVIVAIRMAHGGGWSPWSCA